MQKTKEFTLDDVNYTIHEILAIPRISIGLKASRLFTALGGVLDKSISEGLMLISQNIDTEDTALLFQDLIKHSLRFPRILDDNAYNNHFTEYFHHLIPVCAEILAFNFGKTVNDLKKKLPEIVNRILESSVQ